MTVNYEALRVPVLREFLSEQGFGEDEIVGKRKSDLIDIIDSRNLEKHLEVYLSEDSLADAELEDEDELTPIGVVKKVRDVIVPVLPQRGTKEWNDYILSLFNEDERVVYPTTDGKKIDAVRADGLRRVGELALGKVLFSGPVAEHIDYAGPKGLPCAWVKYKVVFMGFDGVVHEYLSLGDVSYLNTENAYLAFALLTAETRAKGRAWREALGVKTYAIEEFSGKKDTAAAVEEVTSADWQEQPISGGQIRTIKNLTSKLKIDTYKLLNSHGKELLYDGEKIRYTGLDDEALTNKSAATIIGFLNKMQQGTLPVHETLKRVEE